LSKETKIIISILVCGIIIGAGVFYYFNFVIKRPSNKKSTNEEGSGEVLIPLVNIYVNSTIYNSISSKLFQYKQDVIDQGYSVNIIIWSSGDVNILKQNISYFYSNYNLQGVILIGELPYAMGRYYDSLWGVYREFPVDLFLMDLDGTWTDMNGNLKYDLDPGPNFEHSNGTGDWTPEIWLARINPNSIDYPNFNRTNAYLNFFDKTFYLRHGFTYRPHKALLYIDDDWSSYKNEWLSNFTAYTGSQVNCYATNSLTNSTNYMGNITTINYEFVHLLVHSWPLCHTFGPSGNGADGRITYKDIYTNSTLPLFYNLYACFSCNYTQINNTGTYYLFSENTITVIGSSRSGGMDLYQPFYDSLKQGKTIGESFVTWFHNPEIIQLNKQHLYYGMTILGDPLATIYMT